MRLKNTRMILSRTLPSKTLLDDFQNVPTRNDAESVGRQL